MEWMTGGAIRALSEGELRGVLRDGGVVVDIRPPWQFLDAHIPESVSLPLCRRWAEWCAALLPRDRALVLLADGAGDVATAMRLVGGVDGVEGVRFSGWLDAGDSPGTPMDAWVCGGGAFDEMATLRIRTVRTVLGNAGAAGHGLMMLDVRDAGERAALCCAMSEHVPLGTLLGVVGDLPKDRRVVTMCQSGVRSVIAASVLRRRGFVDVMPVEQGLARWWGQYPGDPWWAGAAL